MTAVSAGRGRSKLDALFAPRAIAVLGASTVASKFGHRIVRNLRDGGFPGAVYPVHRSAASIADYTCIPSLSDVPSRIDLLLVAVPAAEVVAGLEAAARMGAAAAVVFSAGFAEEGEAGAALQAELTARAAALGIRVIGPNCMGVRNGHARMDASPMVVRPLPAGPVAFVSQSGAFCSAATVALGAAGIGASKIISIGNTADVRLAELLRYLGADELTEVVSVFMEGVRDPAAFLDAVAEVAARKPVVVLKGGRSALGQAASVSHTSSLAGDGRVWSSLLREAGASVVDSSEELFDVAAAFAHNRAPYASRLPRGRRVAIFTVAGGPAVVAADHCALHELDMPRLDEKLAALRSRVPAFASLRNPIDIPGSLPPELFELCFTQAAKLPEVDAVLGIAVGLDMVAYGEALIRAREFKPVVTSIVGAPQLEATLARCGIPNFSSVDRAVRALRHLVDRGTAPRAGALPAPARPEPVFATPPTERTEAAAKEFLGACGLPVTRERLVASRRDAIHAAAAIGYPVALKISHPEVAHKSDQGGVMLGITDPDEVANGFDLLLQRFPGGAVLVQEMLPGGIELIVGAQRTAASGPVVMVGFGGVLTELLDDVVFARAPVCSEAALAAIGRLRKTALLDGYRGFRAIDRPALASLMARLSEVLVAHPTITEIDLNPVLPGPAGLVIADALIRVAAVGPA